MVVLQKLERREPDHAEVAAGSEIELPLFLPPHFWTKRTGKGKGKERVSKS